MEAQLGLRDALRAHEEVQRTLLTERHDHADLKRQYEHWRQAHEDSPLWSASTPEPFPAISYVVWNTGKTL